MIYSYYTFAMGNIYMPEHPYPLRTDVQYTGHLYI